MKIGKVMSREEVKSEVRQENHCCIDCRVKMQPVKIDVKRGSILIMNITAYRCPKCGKDFLDIETAPRIKREFALMHTENIKGYEVKISSDGRNYLIRFPKELSDSISTKKTAKILPVGIDEFIINVK